MSTTAYILCSRNIYFFHSWTYFPHDHAVFRAYQWGEDGLFALSDSSAKLCVSLALWNGKDKILKERLFGLSGPQVSGIQIKY